MKIRIIDILKIVYVAVLAAVSWRFLDIEYTMTLPDYIKVIIILMQIMGIVFVFQGISIYMVRAGFK